MLIVEARILKAKKVTNMKKGKKSDEDVYLNTSARGSEVNGVP